MNSVIIGIMYSILAGTIVATQNVFSTRISEKVGMWETTVVVHLIGLIIAFAMAYLFGKGSYKDVASINKIYLLAGGLGVMIIFGVTMAISNLGASYAIALMVIAQLGFATIIDTFGLFQTDKIPFSFTRFLGLIVMVIGVLIFQLKG